MMSLDDILNQSEEENRRRELEMQEKENELVDFLDESGEALNFWHEIFVLAKWHPSPKLMHAKSMLYEKILVLAVARNRLLHRYESHLEDWEKWQKDFDEIEAELKRYDADEDETECAMDKKVYELEQLSDSFFEICDEGNVLKARFDELRREMDRLKE